MGQEELELKLGVAPATMARLPRRLVALTGVAPAEERLVATYFDSEDRRLAAAGMALRIREERGRRVQTLKRGRSAAAGLHRSEEHEADVCERSPQVDALPPALRAAVEQQLAGAALRPSFVTDVRRRSWRVETQGGTVEVALDRGTIRSGRARRAVCEVELELESGSPEAIHALAAELLARDAVKLDLPNKAARGSALCDGLAEPALTRSGKPTAPDLDTPAHEAFALALAAVVDAVAANLWATLTTDAPEGPHQLRVALRRLRVLLQIYRPILAPGLGRQLGGWARDLGRLVSPLRDADVLVPQLVARLEGEGAAELRAAHAAIRRRVRRTIRQSEATAAVLRLASLATLGGWQPSGGRVAPGLSATAVVMPILERWWRRARRMGERLAALDDEQQHEFRKSLKRLRYALELVPAGIVDPVWFKALKRLQAGLGDLNDRAVLERFALPLDAPAASLLETARSGLLSSSQTRADQALGRSVRAWRQLRQLPPPRAPQPHRR